MYNKKDIIDIYSGTCCKYLDNFYTLSNMDGIIKIIFKSLYYYSLLVTTKDLII